MQVIYRTYASRQQERHDALLWIVAHELIKPRKFFFPLETLQKVLLFGREKAGVLTSTMYFKTAGMTPAAPFVGDVTIRPPLAFTSFTAIA